MIMWMRRGLREIGVLRATVISSVLLLDTFHCVPHHQSRPRRSLWEINLFHNIKSVHNFELACTFIFCFIIILFTQTLFSEVWLLLKGAWVDVMERVQSDIDPQKNWITVYKHGTHEALEWYWEQVNFSSIDVFKLQKDLRKVNVFWHLRYFFVRVTFYFQWWLLNTFRDLLNTFFWDLLCLETFNEAVWEQMLRVE